MIGYPRIRWIDYVCLLPFIALLGNALIADDWQTNTGIGKHIGLYIVMPLLPLAAGLSFWNNGRRVSFHIVDYLILVWLAIAFSLSYLHFLAVNNTMAIFIVLGGVYFCFRIFLAQRPMHRRMLLLVLMLVGCIEAVWGLLQLYGIARSQHALFRVTGSFFNPGPYAGFLAVILPVAFYYLLWDRSAFAKRRRRNTGFLKVRWGIALLTFVCIALILPATMSRAAWLAAAVGCLAVCGGYFSCFWRPKGKYSKSIGRLIGIGIVLLIIASVAAAGLYHLKKDSADGRMLIWKITVKGADSWVGRGMGAFGGKYGDAQQTYFKWGQGTDRERWLTGSPEYAFNDFLQLGFEQGYLSLALFLFVLLFAFVTGIRYRRFMAVGGLAGVLVFAFFSYPFRLIPFLILLIFFLTNCIWHRFQFAYIWTDPIDIRVRARWNKYTVLAVLLLSTLYFAQTLYKRYPVFQAHQAWNQAQIYYQTGSYEKVVAHYKPLYPLLKDQPHFLFEYGRSLRMIEEFEESTKVLFAGTHVSADPMFWVLAGRNRQEEKKYHFAENHYRYVANLVPNRLYPFYLLAKLYDEMEEYEKAYELAVKVVKTEVKIPSPATKEMKAEMQKYIDQGKKESKKKNEDIKKLLGPILVY